MKTILLLALISLSFCSDYCDDVENVSDAKDCKNLEINEKDGYRCCLFKSKYKDKNGELKEYKGCGSLTKSEFDDIDNYIKVEKAEEELEELDVDCHSNYLNIAFLALLFIFF